ncbi:MAG: hypothetical protein GY893_07970, partial [bacterium]|nr:hypothetical protein [bacterium]
QFGAVESGTEIEKLRLGMEKFTKQLGDAAMGTGTAKVILEKYGISLRNNRGQLRETEDVLMDVVDVLGQTESSFEKNSVLFALFGRTGAQLNALLGQGRGVLDEVIERYDRLGLAISKATLDGVAVFNDKMAEFISIGVAVRDQFFGALAPLFTGLVQSLEDMTLKFLESRGGAEAFGQYMAGKFVDAVKLSIQFFEDFGNAMAQMASETKMSLLSMQIGFFEWMHTLSQTFMGARLGLSEFSDDFAATHDKLLLTWAGLQGVITKPLDFSETIASIERLMNPIAEITVTATKRGEEISSAWTDIFNTIGGAIDATTQAMTASFTAFFNATSDKFLDFKNLAKDIMKMIITDLVKAWTIMNIINPLRGFFGLPSLPGKAAGGTVTAGRPYLVGEKGAELFVPNQTGTIVPNDKMSGGATNVNVAFNITAWDSKDATQAIAQQAPNIVSIVENSFRRKGQILGAT